MRLGPLSRSTPPLQDFDNPYSRIVSPSDRLILKAIYALVALWVFACIAFVILLIALLFVHPASALTISFNDWDISGSQKVSIYNSTSEEAWFVGNTSSKGISLNASESYMILLEPEGSDLFSNPSLLLSSVLSWLEANFIGLLAIVFLISVVFLFLRRRGG